MAHRDRHILVKKNNASIKLQHRCVCVFICVWPNGFGLGTMLLVRMLFNVNRKSKERREKKMSKMEEAVFLLFF